MKNYLSATGLLIIGFLVLTSFSLRELPQDPPRGHKKHIKMVKIEDGKKTVMDTVLSDESVFVLKSDSTKGFEWIGERVGVLDSLKEFKFDFDIDTDVDGGKHKVIMYMTDNGKNKMVKEFKFSDDDAHGNVFFSGDGCLEELYGDHMVWTAKKGSPHVNIIKKKVKGNVIELSDPGIISYKKKKLSGGREKIEIIRNEVADEELENIDVNVIVDEIKGDFPHVEKKIKVIADDDGLVKIIEGGKESEFLLKEMGEGVKEIKKDGKIIRMQKIKKGDKEEVEVKIEVETEEE